VAERNRRMKLALCAKYFTSSYSLPDKIEQADSEQDAELFEETL
jgi:hypothetical protein